MKSKLQLKSDIAKVRKATGNAELREALEQVLTGIVDSLGTGKVSINNIIGTPGAASGDLAELVQAFVSIFEYDKKENAVKLLVPFKNFILGNKDKVVTDIMRSIDETAIDMSQKENAEYLATLDVVLPTLGYLIKTFGSLFLSRTDDDVAEGFIEFRKGVKALSVLVDTFVETGTVQINDAAIFGQFVSGMVGGSGGRIDSEGNAELESVGAREQITIGGFVTGADGQGVKFDKEGNGELQNLRVWNALTVSELRFDRASVLLGTNIQTYCGGVIGKVEKTSATTGYIDLEVEDDEVIGAIQNGALCKGYVNNPATNDIEDSDDWHGDIRYAGTTVAQFAIDWGEGDEPNATNTKHIRYELRPGTTQHPVVGMTFKGVGNMKDASLGFFTIATPKYTAEYAYVQSWVIDNAACCVHVSGADISGFASLIGEQTLNPPHGTICTNMYVRGTYRQISNDRRFIYIIQDSNGVLQDGETETITIKIRDNYLAERTSEFSLTFNGKAIAYDAGKEAFVCTVSFDEIEGEIETFVIKATDGKHELEESIRVRRLRANYNLNVLKSAVNTNAKYDEELTFNDGAPIQYNDSTAIINAVVGDTIMAVRRNGDAVCEVGDLCIRIDNNQEYVIDNYEEVRIYGSVKRVVFTWYADSSHSENKIYARQEIPVISTLNSYVIYHDGTDEPALPPVGMAISDYGWHEGQTSSSRWMSAKTSVDMLSGAWGQPVKIVGEDGRSVGIKGHVPNASALALLTDVKDGDGYITDDDGHLHVYYSGTDSWTDVGRVQGEAGKNAYIHIKYSHDGGNSFSENNGETPAEWMAVYADFNPTDSSNLSDYYGKWKKLTGESSFVSMVFRRSSETSLAAPTGGSFAKPLPDGTDWSDGIPDGSLPIWVSRRIFWSDNRATENWTTPKRMADTADFDVCYHGGEERPSSLPTSHHQSNQGNGWFDNPADCEGGFAVWMATDQLVNGIWQGWKVSRIKGEKGADGKDGASYVGSSNYYLATPTKDAPTTKPTSSELNGWTLGTIPSDYGKNKPYLWNVESIKVVKKGETAESVTFGDIHLLTYYGSDGSDGKGITSITEYFLATAKRETPTVDTGYSTTPVDYSAQKPYLWNKEVILFTDGTTKVQDWHIVAYWGQDGKDADSFELRVASAAANISRGYEDELCFNSGDSLEYNNGKALKTIEAGDRISACRYFNMAVTEVGRLFYQVDDNARTEVANNEEQTVPTDAAHVSFHWIDDNGEEISRKVIPVISNGVTRFVSFAFKRQNEMPNTPVSGMFHHPVPDAEGWSDDIPEGTAKVWMTRRDFYSDDRETSWSTPSPMTDTSDFDVEFSANDNYIAIPEDVHGTEVDKSAWGWKNEGGKDSIWMATSTCKNGVWSQWSYSRIKGEDGRSYAGATELYYASDSDDASKLPNHTISSHADWRSRIGDLAKPYSKERPYLWNFEIVEMIEAGGKSVLRATDPELISYWSKDGKGVESVDERYIATATDDKPTVDPTTCKTNSTEAGFSASKPYLWNNQRTKYSDGSFGEWTGWQQISYWGKDAELYEIRPYSTSANASTGVEEGITFNDGSDIQFNDGVICSTIEKGGTIYACRYYNGKVSTLGKLYVSVNGGSESLTSNNTGLTIGETDRYVTYIWRKDDNSEIVRTNIPVVSDGVTMFKSFVFKRSEKQPATPTTGSFVEPVPYAEGWSDGIPEGEYRVWMSSRVFSSDDRASSWSTPSPMTDTETDDYAYSSSETKPSAPTEHGVQSSSDWHNDPTENDIWMAHDRKINGVWQGWQIMRIKGEQGRKGNKGDSFDEAKYYFKSTKKDVPSPSVSLSNGVPTGWSTSIADTNWGEKVSNDFHYWLWQVVVETVVGNGGNKTYKAQSAQMIDEYDPKKTGVSESYCANNDDKNHPTSGWKTDLSTARANFGKDNQYLWKMEVRTYSDDSTEEFYSIFEKYAEPGAQGVQGCIIRTGEWTSGAEYLNETGKAGGYVDVVLIKNDSSATGWDAYRCKKNQKNGVVKYPPSYPDYWEPMYNIGALFTSLIIAKNAKLTFAQANQLLLQDDSGMVTGGMSGGNGLQIWAGSEGVNEENLPVNPKFGVYSDGKSFSEGSMTTYGKNITVDGKNYRLKVSEYNGNDDGQMVYYYPIVKMLVCAYIKYPTSGSVPELKDDDIKNVTVASPLPKTSPGGQTWTDEPVETNGYYWAGYKYTIYSDTSIKKSAVSPINGIQLSPNHTRTEITQVKMREEAFVYDENGNIMGLQTKYYNKAGNLSWTLDETGGFNASLDHYWSPNNRRYYFADGSSNGIANALSYLNSNAKNPDKFAFPDDKAGVFSIFCSANSTDSSKKQYDGFCVLGSTVSDVPSGMTGFSGVFTSGSIPKRMPSQLPIKDGFLIQDTERYFFDFKIYKNGYQQGFVTFTWDGSRWVSDRLIK